MSTVSTVTDAIRSRWKSGLHVGSAKPDAIIEVQRGIMDRHYAPFLMLDGSEPEFGRISKSKHNAEPWQAYWRATGSWITVPNVLQIETSTQLDGQGIAEPTTATVTIENIGYEPATGPGGNFHKIQRGYYSPWRGYQPTGRARDADVEQNSWFDILNGGYRIRIKQGFGDAKITTFIGLIDDTDGRVLPDEIILTARSFGVLLTDQYLFGFNKAPEVPNPVVFADRLRADNTEKIGYAAKAESTRTGHPASNVLTPGETSAWISRDHTTEDNTEWVQIRLKKGRYETFYLNPGYDGMAVYVSIFARSDGIVKTDAVSGGTPYVGPDEPYCKVDGEIVPNGWVFRGNGDVPGEPGVPIAKEFKKLDAGGSSRPLGFVLECGDNTVLRVHFRKLGRVSAGVYRAKCFRLCAFRRTQKAEAKTNKWVLVDDAADVVKWIFMWAGFKEWRVDRFGVRLKDPIVFHQGDRMIDVVKFMAEQANYVFYIDRPSDHADSIGVPCFVKNHAIENPAFFIEEVRDDDLLTGLSTKFSKANLSFILRTRGRRTKGKEKGVALGEDKTKRIQAVYHPPWSGAHHNVATGQYDVNYPFGAGRVAGLRRHGVYYNELIDSWDEAQMNNILIAIQEALSSYTGSCEMAGCPWISLNDQVSVLDSASGTNSRVWVAQTNTTMTLGPSAEFKTTVAGAMVDSPDLNLIAIDYEILLAKIVAEGGV